VPISRHFGNFPVSDPGGDLAFSGAGFVRNPLRGVWLLLAAGAVWCTANVVFDGCAVEFP
jgi:hypothetical protein